MKLEKRGNDYWIVGKEEEKYIGEEIHGTLFIQRNKAQLLNKWNAYGINAEIIRSGIVNVVILTVDKKQYMITADSIKLHGRLQKFEGFEEQFFVELKQFTEV